MIAINRSALSVTFMLSMACACASSRPLEPVTLPPTAACTSAMDELVIAKRGVEAVVQVVTDQGKGSGVVVGRTRAGELLVATNYHVILGATEVTIRTTHEGRLGSRVVAEVAKADRRRDLALLRVSSAMAIPNDGLQISSVPAVRQQSVLVLGVPAIAGAEDAVTVEDGRITNDEQVLGGLTFLQTNANMNPGSSGGPVLDACGEIVGLATATATSTRRTGLVVPAADLKALMARLESEAALPIAEQVAARMSDFFMAIAYAPEDAAVHVSGDFLFKVSRPWLEAVTETGHENVHEILALIERERGVQVADTSDEMPTADVRTWANAVAGVVEDAPPSIREPVLVYLYAVLASRQLVEPYELLRVAFQSQISNLFRGYESHSVEKWLPSGDAVTAYVRVRVADHDRHAAFRLINHWGDWVIDDIQIN